MRHFKRFIAVGLFCDVVIGAGYAIFRVMPDDSTQMTLKKEGFLRLVKNSAEIHRVWIEGEESREWISAKDACLKEWKIDKKFDESLLRCSPQLLQCVYEFKKQKDFSFVVDPKTSQIYRYLTRSNVSHSHMKPSGVAVVIEDKQSKEQLDLFLTDSCHEVYLEQRIYAYGEPPESKDVQDYRFDNFDQHLYLDRHLVTNAQINDWILFGNSDFTKGLKISKGNDLFLPAVNLTELQMQNFCSFKGKQMMMAHLFDAATFLPMDLEDKTPAKNLRSPYYWTKKKSEYKSDCSLLYAEECLLKEPYRLNSSSPSWAGVMDSMGGVFEAFRNPIDPDSNLKATSFYFPFKSQWHKLGFRASWDGEGIEARNFDFKGLGPEAKIDKFKVGFRCMRGVLND